MLSELAEDFKGMVELKNAKGQVIKKNMVRTETTLTHFRATQNRRFLRFNFSHDFSN